MISRLFVASIAVLALAGCASSKVAVKDTPPEEWPSLEDVFEKRNMVDPNQGKFGLLEVSMRSPDMYFVAKRFVDAETSAELPPSSIMGAVGDSEEWGDVFVPLNYIVNIKKGRDFRGKEYAVFTFNLGEDAGKLSSLFNDGVGILKFNDHYPAFRYLDFENQTIGYVKLQGESIILGSNKATIEEGPEEFTHVASSFNVVPAEEAKKAIASAQKAVASAQKNADQRNKQRRLLRQKQEIATRIDLKNREKAFRRAQAEELHLGTYVCSRDNRIAVVEVVGKERIKLSLIGKIHGKPDYYWFQNEGNVTFTKFESGKMFWARKSQFASCDSVTISR